MLAFVTAPLRGWLRQTGANAETLARVDPRIAMLYIRV
jgi:hypothetical protein